MDSSRILCLLGIIKHSFENIIQCPDSKKKTTDPEKWFKCLQKLNAFGALADCTGLGGGSVQNFGVLQPVLQLLLPSVCTRCTRSAFIIFQDVRTRLSEAENQLQLQFYIEYWNIPKDTYYIRILQMQYTPRLYNPCSSGRKILWLKPSRPFSGQCWMSVHRWFPLNSHQNMIS